MVEHIAQSQTEIGRDFFLSLIMLMCHSHSLNLSSPFRSLSLFLFLVLFLPPSLISCFASQCVHVMHGCWVGPDRKFAKWIDHSPSDSSHSNYEQKKIRIQSSNSFSVNIENNDVRSTMNGLLIGISVDKYWLVWCQFKKLKSY